jgi:ABC-2 type transport system permease protein
MKIIYLNILKRVIRQKHLQLMSIIIVILYILVGINSAISYKNKIALFDQAKANVRKAWLNQPAQNPHSSAHYGHYVFQPVTALNFLDNGVTDYLGSVLKLEGHRQNDAAFSPIMNNSEMARLGEINFSWVLQVLIPLFIILMSFNSISAEFEQNNIKLLKSQGASIGQLLWGNVCSILTILLTLFLVGVFFIFILYALLTKQPLNTFPFSDFLIWISTYMVYFFILILFSVIISALVKVSKLSFLILLSFWVFSIIILPKLIYSTSRIIYPYPSKQEFTKTLNESRKKGIDGHDPMDQRTKQFNDSLLLKYNVKSLDELPINADGLIMQADEDYANKVYDKHFSDIRTVTNNQNQLASIISIINPFLAIKNISMTIAQSDYNSNMIFLSEAEQYRRYLIKELNTKMAYGGSKTGEWDWSVDVSYWNTVRDFSYPQAPLLKRLSYRKIEIISLFLWVVILIVSIKLIARNYKIV